MSSPTLRDLLTEIRDNPKDLPEGFPVGRFRAFIAERLRSDHWPGQAQVLRPGTLLVEYCPSQDVLHIETIIECFGSNLRGLVNHGAGMPCFVPFGAFDKHQDALLFSEAIRQIKFWHARSERAHAAAEVADVGQGVTR